MEKHFSAACRHPDGSVHRRRAGTDHRASGRQPCQVRRKNSCIQGRAGVRQGLQRAEKCSPDGQEQGRDCGGD